MSNEDICPTGWVSLDPAEIEHVVSSVIQGGEASSEDYVAFPKDGDECRLRLHYSKDGTFALTRGPAFDRAEWESVERKVDDELVHSKPVIARVIAFSSYRVRGAWLRDRLGLAILPPPPGAPLPPVELAEHPFLLEFTMQRSNSAHITILRRAGSERRICMLLNVLLEGRITHNSTRVQHFWGVLPDASNTGTSGVPNTISWIQRGYWAAGFPTYSDTLSKPTSHLELVPASDYYGEMMAHHMGRELRAPDILEELLNAYFTLPAAARDRLDRACFWYDWSSRAWPDSQSASYSALATALESMLDPPSGPHCPKCRKPTESITASLEAFIDEFAPGERTYASAPATAKAYALRSAILHGARLLSLDRDVFMSLNPAGYWKDHVVHSDLQERTRQALVNWLLKQSSP